MIFNALLRVTVKLKKKKKMENLQLCTYFTDNVLGDIE